MDNLALAREFLFDFLDNLHTALGLEQKNVYTTDEIKKGLGYMRLWVEEALKEKVIVGRMN